MTKYNNKKTIIDDITFDSKNEEDYGDKLIELLKQKNMECDR